MNDRPEENKTELTLGGDRPLLAVFDGDDLSNLPKLRPDRCCRIDRNGGDKHTVKRPWLSVSGFFIWLALCCGGGLAATIFVGLSFWAGFGVVAAALAINSLIAEIEDSAP